ncbi:MAG: tetratricopeptide repeat protein [Asgard group archaeon]|nr:tetratricopeptide repeat protein [Asgard group archaeon]
MFYCTGGKYLSSIVEKQLQEVEQLIIHGKYQTAQKEIEELMKKKELENNDRLYCLILQSDIQNDLGGHKKALGLAEQVLEETKEADGFLLRAAAFQYKAVALLFLTGEKDEALNCLEKGLELLEKSPKNIHKKELSERKGWLLNWKAMITRMFGDFEKGLDLTNKAFVFAEESGNKRLLSRCLIVIGTVYFVKFEHTKAEEFYNKARKIAKEIDNKFLIAITYFLTASIRNRRRQPSQAIELMEKGFNLYEEIGTSFSLSGWFSNLANNYKGIGQFDTALKYYQKSLDTGVLQKHSTLHNMGHLYYLKYDLENARKYFLQSMELSKEKNDIYALVYPLFHLIIVSIRLKDNLQAKNYLDQLKQLHIETGFKFVTLHYRLAEIIVLKESTELTDWGKAIEKLKEILAEEGFLDLDSKYQALHYLLELRLKELQISPTEETLTEVKKQAIRLEVEAEEQNRKGLLMSVYRLQSQLALVELDAKKAIDLLDKAQEIAEEFDVEFFYVKLREDQEKINKQLDMLRNLENQKAPISDAIKLVSLDNAVQKIKEETLVEERDKETGKIIEYRKLFSLRI